MNLDLKKVYRKRKGVIFRKILDEMVLLDTKGGEVLILNEIGGEIWEAIDGNRSLQDIAEFLVTEYDESKDVIVKDLIDFVSQLIEAGIVEEVS